jgi:hypothetical protein
MKYLKYVVPVVGVALVALLAWLSMNGPRAGKARLQKGEELSLRGINSNALTQSAPRADYYSDQSAPPPVTQEYAAAVRAGKKPAPGGSVQPRGEQPRPSNAPPKAGIEDSDVRVALQLDPLKMGGVYAHTYKADFTADYVIKNLQDQGAKLTFYFPFPPNAGTMYDLMLLVNGQEPEGVLYSAQGIQYSDTFAPREERPIHITYKAYGMGSFNYGLEHNRRVRKLHAVVEVKGTEGVNLANNVLMPTDRKTGAGATTYTWDLANLITSADIGIELSRRPRTTSSPAEAGRLALPLYISFLLALVATRMRKATRREEKQVPWVTLLVTSFAFILFYPFLAFTLPRLPTLWAVVLSVIPGAILASLFLVRHAGFAGGVAKGAIPLILIQGGITLAVLSSDYGAIALAITLTILLVWLLWVARDFRPGEQTS